MNHAEWKAKRFELFTYIKKVSDGWGGDEIEWLRAYAQDVLDNNGNIDMALACFRDLIEQLRYLPTKKRNVLHGTSEKETIRGKGKLSR